jgi:formimidoylglutamate deiminase
MPDSFMGETEGIAWLPDYVYTGGRFESEMAVVCDSNGRITHLTREIENATRVVRLKNRAMLPGLVNAHSHAFQRVIRGRTERRTGTHDSFWTWREMMYSAATRLGPEEIYDASRMAFLEMALGGITGVGEFHYIHRAPDGSVYDDANMMAKAVIKAARDVGLRIALLRVAYARSGYQAEPNERQKRFIEPEVDIYLRHVEDLNKYLTSQDGEGMDGAWVGVAPHSVRAVPLEYILDANRFAVEHGFPVHMHVAEQPAEVTACLKETGCTPLMLLGSEGVLGPHFTGVHVIHIESPTSDVHYLKKSGAMVCACPTTERNLGDGIVPADLFFKEGVSIALGTDSHAQIDLLEDARELEYHLRLSKLERSVLAPLDDDSLPSLARRLFECATRNGARSIHSPGGKLEPGSPADFFTVDLNDPSIAGAAHDDLLACIVFGLARTAVREVYVEGQPLVAEGQHEAQGEIIEKFAALQRKLWS